MNGNFEVDRSAYPYGPQYIGAAWYVVYIPTQNRVIGQPLPRELAARVAVRLNAQWYSSLPESRKEFAGSHAEQVTAGNILREELRFAVADKSVDGAVAQQVFDRIGKELTQ